MKYLVTSTQKMESVARDIASALSGGEVFGLMGELGSGKTTFVQSLARALGVKEPVRSPTFTLLQTYQTTHPIIKYLVHADLYRLEGKQNIISEIGLDEWLHRPDAVVCIEWPWEEVQKQIPNIAILQFSYGKSEMERIIISH